MVISNQELLRFEIVDRDEEVGETSDDKQVLAIAREGETDAFEGGLHLEISDEPLAWHLVDVAAWVETTLSGSYQPMVVGRGDAAVAVSSWTPIEII